MGRRVLNVDEFITRESLACIIANRYDQWKRDRAKWESTVAEVRNYVFAIDTTTTANASLPWKNKTTRPKLCQIRDNLHANYMAALFPTEDWFDWRPADEESADVDKANAIKVYMRNKLKDGRFEETISRLVYDFIDNGNVISDAEFVNESYPQKDGTTVTAYIGPRAVRISPHDIVFDVTAASFEQSPKITRSLLTLGDIKKFIKINPDWREMGERVFAQITDNRRQTSTVDPADLRKTEGLVADGFSGLGQYYSSGMVEVLEFEGDMFDLTSGTLLENHIVTVVDRSYIIRKEPIKTWTGRSTKQHCGWRLRPDNLMAMGPLDNLVGLQYRIDHLENLRADVFDLTAYPVHKVKGFVEEYNYGPGERIFMDQEADVEFMHPDTLALNADMQIAELEQQMEEMAGAPKQAMGFRTPGEKTKFEVQSLDNAASRVFQSKITYFERHVVEPLLNTMLELARRNMDAAEVLGVIDDDLGFVKFMEISRDDITAKGRLTPMGARHFAAQAQLIQNLTTLSQTPIFQSPSVSVHWSGFRLAKLLEDNLGLSQYKLVQNNIGVFEQTETKRLLATAEDQVATDAMTPTMTEEDIPPDEDTSDQTGTPTFN